MQQLEKKFEEIKKFKLVKKIRISWHKALKNLLSFGKISFFNEIEIYHDGDTAFEEICSAIKNAQESVYLETYNFEPDSIGLMIRDCLILACKNGAKVTVIYDHFGSSNLNKKFLQPLFEQKATIMAFNPIWSWRRKGPLLFRDHRKTIVVDKKISFCGGMNISSGYAGKKYGSNVFRDSIAKITGEASLDLLDIVLQSIEETTLTPSTNTIELDSSSLIPKFPLGPLAVAARKIALNKSMLQVLQSNTRRSIRHIQSSMEKSLATCVGHCYFTTPYFLPYRNLKNAMIDAKKRGVDVRILTAGLSDVPLMRLASHHVYEIFLSNGIKIYEMNEKTLHAKLMTMDDIYSSIGSYNLDRWSYKRNLEVNVGIVDKKIALNLKEQFYTDLLLSKEITLEGFKTRNLLTKIISWFCYLIFRL